MTANNMGDVAVQAKYPGLCQHCGRTYPALTLIIKCPDPINCCQKWVCCLKNNQRLGMVPTPGPAGEQLSLSESHLTVVAPPVREFWPYGVDPDAELDDIARAETVEEFLKLFMHPVTSALTGPERGLPPLPLHLWATKEITGDIVEVVTDRRFYYEWLIRNSRNRLLKKAEFRKLVAEMQADGWVYNGDTFTIGSDGIVQGGQKRALAGLLTGKSFRAIVVTNLDPKAQFTAGRNQPVTVTDRLTMAGFPIGPSGMNAVRIVDQMLSGELFDAPAEAWRSSNRGRAQIPEEKAQELLRRHSEFIDVCLPLAKRAQARTRLTETTIAVAWYVLHSISYAQAQVFLHQLVTGAIPNKSTEEQALDPILRLRETLGLGSLVKPPLTATLQLSLIFKAWNSWTAGTERKTMYTKKRERFCKPTGFDLVDWDNNVWPGEPEWPRI